VTCDVGVAQVDTHAPLGADRPSHFSTREVSSHVHTMSHARLLMRFRAKASRRLHARATRCQGAREATLVLKSAHGAPCKVASHAAASHMTGLNTAVHMMCDEGITYVTTHEPLGAHVPSHLITRGLIITFVVAYDRVARSGSSEVARMHPTRSMQTPRTA
jgi:hypothetical protein